MIDRVFQATVLILVAGICLFTGAIASNYQHESQKIELIYQKDSTELYYKSMIDTSKLHLIKINDRIKHKPCKKIVDNILYMERL